MSDLRFLLEIQAILPETSLFLSAQMAVLSSFFQMFIVLGMYNFGLGLFSNGMDLNYHFTGLQHQASTVETHLNARQ